MSVTAVGRPVAAAQVALVGCALFVGLLALLHLVKPELDPSWHFISEYAIGENGWLMHLAFLALAVAYLGLALGLAPHLCGLGGRLGLALAPSTTSAGRSASPCPWPRSSSAGSWRATRAGRRTAGRSRGPASPR